MARPSAKEQLDRYTDAKTVRNKNENDWRLASAYVLPQQYNSWQTDGPPVNNGSAIASTRRIAYDTTGARALPKYAAVLERMVTPHNMRYHNLTANDVSLQSKRRVKEYFDSLNRWLFSKRYEAMANFKQAAAEVYLSMGVYGTGPVYVGQRSPSALSRKPGFFYRACGLRDVWILVNDEGMVDTVMRRFFLNARQFRQKFPKSPLPKCYNASDKDNDYKEFIHIVHPRTDYDPKSLMINRHPFCGSYVCVPDVEYVGEEQGYRSLPYLTPRTFTTADDPYGFSPTMQALPALGTASAMKKTNLKLGQKAADPVLLAHDDGVLNGSVDLRPGAVNYGAIDKQGRRLIGALESGSFKVTQEMTTEEREDINDCFFVTLFRILTERPEMTAAQVYDEVADKVALLSPTMGRLQSEFMAPLIGREIDMGDEMGMLPQMPPELIEAQGEYEIVYTSPMAKSMYAEEVSGFMRSVSSALEVASATGDPSHLDHFNFDVAIPESADRMGVPPRWMNDEARKKEIAESRAESQQKAELMKNAAPLAGALKTAASMQQGQPAPVMGQQPTQ